MSKLYSPEEVEQLAARVLVAETQAQRMGAAFDVIQEGLQRKYPVEALNSHPGFMVLAQAAALSLSLPKRPEGWGTGDMLVRLDQLEADCDLMLHLMGIAADMQFTAEQN